MRTFAAMVAIGFAAWSFAQEREEPPYVDDDVLALRFEATLGARADEKKGLGAKKAKRLTEKDRVGAVTLPPPRDQAMTPEEAYVQAKASTFVFGAVKKEDGKWVVSREATAWAATADGVLVTNWHLFDKIEDGEVFGAMTRGGEVYPVVDVLAVDRVADVAAVRIEAKNLVPLPLARAPAKVASWVGVLGHPGGRYFTFTQGTVTRYEKLTTDNDVYTRWMSIDADFANGSSGSPVIDRFGNVVGMAAVTEAIDAPDDPPADPKKASRRRPARLVQPPVDGKKPPEAKKDADPRGSSLQMVVKLAAPAAEILRVLGAK